MKTKFLLAITFLFATGFAVAQDDCSIYYPMKEGVKFQITHYKANKKKPTSVVDYAISDVKKTSNGTVSTLKMKVSGESKIPEQEIELLCSGDKLSIDFESLMSPELLKQYGTFDYEISGSNLDWPSNLSVGSSLPDAGMEIGLSMAGMTISVETSITNRKVTAKEKVTTPAGTFDCYVMTYDTSVSSMGMNTKISSKQWFAKGIGMVKQEDSSKGKLQSISELTAFSQ